MSAKGRKTVRKRKGGHGWIGGLSFTVVAAAFAFLQLLSYLSVVVNPVKTWFFSLFGLMFPLLFLVNSALLVWAVARRPKYMVLPLLAILPSLFFVGRFIRFSGPEEMEAVSGTKVKILTYNVDRFAYKSRKADQKERMDSVFNFLSSSDADIICLQEFSCADLGALQYLVKNRLPGYFAEYYLFKGKNRYSGNVTLSRNKAVAKGKILFEDSVNLALWSEYDYGGERFRVYNCHFESYAISLSSIWHSLTGNKEKMQETGQKYRKSLSRRPEQVDAVLSHFDESPCAGVVCGDFNDNPMSYTYHRMRRASKDSFVEAGKGFGASFSAFWPFLRIDYVFVPESWEVLSHKTSRIRFSDHYPIVAECIAKR